MTKRIRQMASWILTICMLAGLAPAPLERAAAVDQPVYLYEFRQAFSQGAAMGSADNAKNMPWSWTDMGESPNAKFVYDSSWKYAQYGASAARFSDGEFVELRVEIPRDGVYSAEIMVYQKAWSGSADVYLAPQDAIDPTAEQYLLGRADSSNAAGNGWKSVGLAEARLVEGSYRLFSTWSREAALPFKWEIFN